MKHLIICREFPPARGGGIGTYVSHAARMLAESGETVHVVAAICEGAELARTQQCDGRLIVHRVPFDDWTSLFGPKPHPSLQSKGELELFRSSFHQQCFSWSAAILIEKLIQEEGIDIVEAQEYEAPLYFFQVRRALKLGPSNQPPCLVHLHSPTQFISMNNDWRPDSPSSRVATRLEEFSIQAADALLCPSRYLARQVQQHYELPEKSVEVIPYPHFESGVTGRTEEVWRLGTICYVGRLEPRKGVLEWIETAVKVAEKNPAVRFEFIGENVLGNAQRGGRAALASLIPRRNRRSFRFRGACSRAAIPYYLSRARMAVVPSRWDNFPYTCIEAMCSGVPVLATSSGGMAEMIEDNRTGWIAKSTNELDEALDRALSCSPHRLKEMGNAAQESIRKLCNPQLIFKQQSDFRKNIVERGAVRSLHLPRDLDWLDTNLPKVQMPSSDCQIISDISQMVIDNDGAPVSHAVEDRISPLRVAIDNPIHAGTVLLHKIRGKMLRRLKGFS